MVEFAKRPEVTVTTMGKVHNPSGEGVRAVSSQAQAKAAKVATKTTPDAPNNTLANGDSHETKVKEGTAKRNITRKKTADKESGNYNSAHKKQGGHGKGQWKDVMDPSYTEEIPIDVNDPIYDKAEDSDRYILTSIDAEADKRGYDQTTEKAVYGPMLTLQEFKFQLLEALKEYFDSCDTDEVIRTLEELGCKEYNAEIPKKAISLAMDKGPRERELTSRLLTCLHPTPLSMSDMEAGFISLLDSLEDLITDVPDAHTMVASFLARAVVDEVLPPAFLSEQNNDRPGDAVVEKAVNLLSREHCNARLEKVWGPGDGRPVAELKVEMDQLLEEYLLSRELDEAARCVKELDCRHFHHELIKRGTKAAMEVDGKKSTDDPAALSNLDAMAALFAFLVRNAIVSEYQVKKGVSRLHQILEDIALDVPTAPKLLESFESMLAVESKVAEGEEVATGGE
uniref:MI domain-containing protein n=1 Tax=Entomoneis paludosa TaxID=265537 RepID=A0A6U3BV92_9STRA|mmetsp:Transcript_32501/g.67771  ORF Transcript_32501/g.67771 Transcript_32501/m.67771 type:complete len:454 (+) Transcript_32501:141-1502(+)|eukprot:CAMPEP_0172449684 /NCGR_PEP_ID=MMETSP1065-20121228/8328_1 /TAXON_ID=265537 /ORGANISM="Amphiprora paludosa, Strain CCMP125" /LENGTH=453 /DNA_ID=CAMNT_0013201405 /DNA_START=65 /DNA_END=1426 /DNA_ORIENTATION=-